MAAPNTQIIMDTIVSYLAGMQVNNQNLFSNVIEGGLSDFTNMVPCAVVTVGKGVSTRAKATGTVWNSPKFNVLCLADYTNQQTAEQQIISFYDNIIPTFAQHSLLGGLVQGVQDARIVPESVDFGWVEIGGVVYRCLKLDIEVMNPFIVTVGA